MIIAKRIIADSIKDNLIPQVSSMETPKEMFDALSGLFEGRNINKSSGFDRVHQVLAKGVECDIALLSVESEEFWKGTEHLCFGRLPCLQDAVTVVGYPLGEHTLQLPLTCIISCLVKRMK